MQKKLICPITGVETNTSLFEQRGEWSLVECQSTGFVFLANPPDYDKLEKEFAWEVSFEKERERRRKQEPIRSKFSDWFKRTRLRVFKKRNKLFDVLLKNLNQERTKLKILDIGCGGGRFMVDVQSKCADLGLEMKPFGIEVSKELASKANRSFQQFSGSVVFDNAIDGTRH
ncbi:MAG: class I SAM-dependent methyltransferase, partial [Pseudomonadota bacterium]